MRLPLRIRLDTFHHGRFDPKDATATVLASPTGWHDSTDFELEIKKMIDEQDP